MRFAWDDRKAAANERKHSVSFEEAATVFLDDNGLLLADPDHSEDEKRFLLLGLRSRQKINVAICTLRFGSGSICSD